MFLIFCGRGDGFRVRRAKEGFEVVGILDFRASGL